MNEVESSARVDAGSHRDMFAFVREVATDAVRYWEPRRLLYDGVLAAIVLACFAASWPASRASITLDTLQTLFVLAVMANVFYCAAYVADVFVQLTGFRAAWRRWRWLLLGIGITFAAIPTRSIAVALFARKLLG